MKQQRIGITILGAVMIIAGLITNVALADTVIVCRNDTNGNMRMVSSTSDCRHHETAVFLHAVGPAGVMWINHLEFLPGDVDVTTSFNSTTSGVGGGLSGLIIGSTTLGDTSTAGGNKVVEQGVQVPPGYLIKGVRVCYELSNARSFITQIRLAQLQSPPSTALVMLDDGTDLTTPGPMCVDSAETTVDPIMGEVRLNLRVNYGDTSDKIVLRGVGLNLQPK